MCHDGNLYEDGFENGSYPPFEYITTLVPILQLSYIHFASPAVRRIHPCEQVVPNLLYALTLNACGLFFEL